MYSRTFRAGKVISALNVQPARCDECAAKFQGKLDRYSKKREMTQSRLSELNSMLRDIGSDEVRILEVPLLWVIHAE